MPLKVTDFALSTTVIFLKEIQNFQTEQLRIPGGINKI